MIFIGIDPGLASCGFAAVDIDGRLQALRVITTKKGDGVGDAQSRLGELLVEVRRTFGTCCELPSYTTLTVEWPLIGGRNPGERRATAASSAAQAFAVTGAVIGALEQRCRAVHTPIPMTWRTKLHGSRTNARAVLEKIDRQYAVTEAVGRTKAPHAIDALGLALYGLHLHNLDTLGMGVKR